MKGNNLRVFQHLNSIRHDDICAQFESLYKQKNVRKGGIKFQHIIQSYSPLDTPNLTEEIISDLAYKYIETTYPTALVYGVLHSSEGHQHIHLLVSSNHVHEPERAIRLSKADFLQSRIDLENYQKKVYPHLKHSLCYTNEKKKEQRYKPKKYESIKAELIEFIAQTFDSPDSKDWNSFYEKVGQREGIELYAYRGKINGLLYQGKKYRFSTLGLTADKKKILDQLDKLHKTREGKTHSKDQDFNPLNPS